MGFLHSLEINVGINELLTHTHASHKAKTVYCSIDVVSFYQSRVLIFCC